MRALALAALLTITVLAGCASDPTSDQDNSVDLPVEQGFRPEVNKTRLPAVTEDLSHVVSSDHGGLAYLHAVPELHRGSLNIELVGYNPLTRPTAGDGAGSDSGYIAVDTWKNLVCISHFAGSGGAFGGATIVDIEDPANPVVLSSLLSGSVNSDCQFTDDGKYLVLATYTGAATPINTIVPPPVGDVGANGMNLYDVTDPSNPVFLFHDAQGAGGDGYHNVFTAQINGTHYIFQTYTGNILKIKDDASGLEMVSKLPYSNHDFWVGQHPISAEWVVVTGAGYGTAVINVDDPANPVEVGLWEGDRSQRFAGWHRQWPLENTVDGRAYMVVAGEECGNGDTLPYQVLEWTDPSNITMKGTWWIPGKPGNPAQPHLCEMNSHEFEIWDGYVATGNYHAGVWLFDVGSSERVMEPATIGYYMPTEIPQMNGGTLNTPFVWSPNTWGAYFDERGYIVTADWHSGLYVLKFGATPA